MESGLKRKGIKMKNCETFFVDKVIIRNYDCRLLTSLATRMPDSIAPCIQA